MDAAPQLFAGKLSKPAFDLIRGSSELPWNMLAVKCNMIVAAAAPAQCH